MSGVPCNDCGEVWCLDCGAKRVKAKEAAFARLLTALGEAAMSLETISELAGIDEHMNDTINVRAYARNRAKVARDALASFHARLPEAPHA